MGHCGLSTSIRSLTSRHVVTRVRGRRRHARSAGRRRYCLHHPCPVSGRDGRRDARVARALARCCRSNTYHPSLRWQSGRRGGLRWTLARPGRLGASTGANAPRWTIALYHTRDRRRNVRASSSPWCPSAGLGHGDDWSTTRCAADQCGDDGGDDARDPHRAIGVALVVELRPRRRTLAEQLRLSHRPRSARRAAMARSTPRGPRRPRARQRHRVRTRRRCGLFRQSLERSRCVRCGGGRRWRGAAAVRTAHNAHRPRRRGRTARAGITRIAARHVAPVHVMRLVLRRRRPSRSASGAALRRSRARALGPQWSSRAHAGSRTQRGACDHRRESISK